MLSPFLKWCYRCDHYRQPKVQNRFRPVTSRGGRNTQAVSIEYRMVCPVCNAIILPDRKHNILLNLLGNAYVAKLKNEIGIEGDKVE